MSRFNDIKVREKDGFTTFYDPEDQKFVLRDPDGNEVGSGITQEKAERKLLMKALSIKQPYAWLIGKGIKDVENRIWWIHMPPLLNYPAMPRHIYVHASLCRSEMTKLVLAQILKRLNNRQAAELMLAYPGLSLGAIIGEVDIVGCTDKSDSPWFTGPYALMLSRGILYDKPIPCKGKLGFFEVYIAGRKKHE